MPCEILHPMVWGISVNSLTLKLKTIYLFLPCKLIFWKATKVGSPPNFPKLISQLWEIPQPQYFVTSLLEPHWTYFWKHYIYHKEDTKVGSQNLATKFGFVPDWFGPVVQDMAWDLLWAFFFFFFEKIDCLFWHKLVHSWTIAVALQSLLSNL